MNETRYTDRVELVIGRPLTSEERMLIDGIIYDAVQDGSREAMRQGYHEGYSEGIDTKDWS